jgi:hypothetical protein
MVTPQECEWAEKYSRVFHEKRGDKIESYRYHDAQNKEFNKAMWQADDPEIYMETVRPDWMCITSDGESFFVEAKTRTLAKYPSVEFGELLFALKSPIDVHFEYFVKHLDTPIGILGPKEILDNIIGGVVHFTNKFSRPHVAEYLEREAEARGLRTRYRVVDEDWRGWSGDPYIKFDPDIMKPRGTSRPKGGLFT